MHPKQLSIADFTYSLPEEKIAAYPLAERDASILLIYKDGVINTDTYANIATYLQADSLLVFNNTKVVEARLLFQKPTGGIVEIFCLEPHEQYTDVTTAMLQQGKVLWQCLVGGASKWKEGQLLELKVAGSPEIILHAALAEKRKDCFVIELSWMPGELSFAELLHHAGAIPLPPYIKRKVTGSDTERYQTVYAKQDGSVAAPTAGLHFTQTIFDSLSTKNIQTAFVTLHVGAGTFKPVKAATIGEHDMHSEFIDVSISTIEKIINQLGKPIIPVGTTSMRTIESLYWLGVKAAMAPDTTTLLLEQWDPYDFPIQNMPAKDALTALIHWLKAHNKERLITKTSIIIAPGYQLRLASALITNFHQPQSTLLLLIAAITGAAWKTIYQYALENDFRFLSYGDGCLLFPVSQ
jgi:S-adenosylmethionine:tRNA ribosyltransferase-isomerase